MTLQTKIIEELQVKPQIDPQQEIREIIDFLKGYMYDYNFLKTFVLGISGGQDSTLAGKLVQLAVDELNNEGGAYEFIAVRLPYGTQRDASDVADAISFIQPTRDVTINIKQAVDASVISLKEAGYTLTDFQKGNEKARERMKAQYSIAANTKGVVIGTDHAAESITGFYTKFGDGGADILPLAGLNKRQGKMLLQALGCPEHLYNKIPTADLEDDKPLLPDTEALGVSYEAIDDYLEGKEVAEEDKVTIERHFINSQHKRMMPISRFNKSDIIK